MADEVKSEEVETTTEDTKQEEQKEAKAQPEQTQKQDADADISGLKSALEKERASAKELKAQLKQAQEALDGLNEIKQQFEATQGELNSIKEQNARRETFENALKEAGKNGLVVDAEKLGPVVSKLPTEGFEEAVTALIEAAGRPAEERKTERPFKGQPAAETTIPDIPLGRMFTENPEAYRALREKQKAANPFSK